MKKANRPFLSKYRIFNYRDELSKTTPFSYSPQPPDSFIKEFADYFENTVNWDSPGVLYNIHPNVNVYGQIASFLAEFTNPNFAQDILTSDVGSTDHACADGEPTSIAIKPAP